MKRCILIACTILCGCSDDGVYTPVEQEPPPGEVACAEKTGCHDAGDGLDAGDDALIVDASK